MSNRAEGPQMSQEERDLADEVAKEAFNSASTVEPESERVREIRESDIEFALKILQKITDGEEGRIGWVQACAIRSHITSLQGQVEEQDMITFNLSSRIGQLFQKYEETEAKCASMADTIAQAVELLEDGDDNTDLLYRVQKWREGTWAAEKRCASMERERDIYIHLYDRAVLGMPEPIRHEFENVRTLKLAAIDSALAGKRET